MTEMPEDLTKDLGCLIATSCGDGHYAKGVKRSVMLHIVATVDPSTITRGNGGEITYAYCSFNATFSKAQWDTGALGKMYTDSGIADAINRYLRTRGFVGTVGWSEAGRQQSNEADFDMDYELIDQFWPNQRVGSEARHSITS